MTTSIPHSNHHRFLRRTAAGLFALAAFSATGAHARLDVGDKAPNVLLVEAGTGRGVLLARSVEGNRLTVLAFVSTRCEASMSLDEPLAEARARYRSAGVEFLAIHASNEDERAVAAHALSLDDGIVALRDRDAQLANILGADRMPEVFVVDGAGQIVYRGLLHADAPHAGLDDVIPALLRGESPRVASHDDAPACGIRGAR
jgi:hypothetical protein